MAATTLPVTLGVIYDHKNIISSTKPFHVSLPLRSPNKPCPLVNPEKPPHTVAPLKNPEPCNAVARKCTVSDVLHLMDALSLPTPPEMYASLIKECTETADSCGAQDVHDHVTRNGLRKPLPLLNRLLLMHVSQNRVGVARELFDAMPSKDFKSWAVVIVAYVNLADYEEALGLFLGMLDNVSMIEFPGWVMVCLLKTCACTENVDLAKQVHACSLKLDHANNPFLASCLISFYGKFGCLESADLVFNQLPRHSSVTWLAKLINSSRERLFLEVVRDFNEIGKAGTIKKSASMFSCVLKACARMNDHGDYGRQVHGNAVKLGFESDPYVQCGLVDMYGRSGLIDEAKSVFEMYSERRNNACWNAMLGGYIRNELYVEAIKFVYEMKSFGVRIQQSLIDKLGVACGSYSVKEV